MKPLSLPKIEPDVIEDVLAWHGGDARTAIFALLNDCQHLRLQLALTEAAASSGFTRGWRPRFDRQDNA
ncbi:dehydrogenase [Rhizobium rhizosphaerae]|uniref:Dehydrogenase n=1 Tax=Xaviernesmea rhizosphaerae TaxID=1672749 RepID=A0A1Q9ACI8_9HYPH|nr:dehydrogenase [Xaviernesmea rhizosphaerae]OLP52613.1 dehydrogenase [Xaviernesmea rhizosphaerae]